MAKHKQMTPDKCLIDAAENGDLDLVVFLLKGTSVDAQIAAFIKAIVKGHLKIVDAIVNRNDKLKNKEWIEALTRTTILLLEEADVDLRYENGETVLMWAAKYGYLDVVKVLIERGANVNLEDKYGNTALMVARKYGKGEVVSFLEPLV